MARLSPSALLMLLVGWVASGAAAENGVSYAAVRQRTEAAMQERTYEVMEALETLQGVSHETALALEKLGASCNKEKVQARGDNR
mmetsp:Transcript_41845/g.116592  ORF Transcript_41845/g.116592 Transcript_41845/m.116592 type:complete len:85 (-) Transcript_41845:151-405(-)